MLNQGFFVTGTDTEVGKTTVTASLLYLMAAAGHRVAGIKPIATGCVPAANGLRSEDAEMLMQYSSVKFDYPTVNPYVFLEPASPNIAARKAHSVLRADELVRHCRGASAQVDYLLVEGVGGWLVPINEAETMADVAKGLVYPALLVVGIRLGCINHALLTVESIERSGVRLVGWVANIIDRQAHNVPEIIDSLIVRIDAPLIGIIPPFRAVTPEKISEFLNLSSFLKELAPRV